MTGRLDGKRALITGAASGIGRATAIAFCREGARVALVDIDEDGLRETAKLAAGEVRTMVADVTREADLARATGDATDAWSGLDVVVANAAIQLFDADARAHELDLDSWNRTLAVNLTGTFLTCKHGIRALLGSGGGAVVCTASPTGMFGMATGFDAYSASKGGILGLTRVLAHDYASDGIRVNAVLPGLIDTPLVSARFDDEATLAERLRAIPMRRPGTAREVSQLMVFLASEESAYMTGGLYPVDGGMTAV